MKSKLIELLLRLLAHLPFSAQRGLGRFLGKRMLRKQGREARITRINLQRCFPEKGTQEIEKLLEDSLIATATMAVETAAVWFRDEKWRNQLIVGQEGKALFDEAVQDSRGLILLAPHFGNWELAGMCSATHAPTTAIYRKPRLEAMDNMLQRVRSEGDTTMVPASSRGVMAVLKALGRGEMTVILPDQEPAPEGGIFSPFFGQQALTMTLIHRLIEKTSPRVLMVYARRVENGHILGYFEPDQAIYSADQQTSVDALNRSIERMVELAPEQYQWEYKRFRKRPPGQSDFYKS